MIAWPDRRDRRSSPRVSLLGPGGHVLAAARAMWLTCRARSRRAPYRISRCTPGRRSFRAHRRLRTSRQPPHNSNDKGEKENMP